LPVTALRAEKSEKVPPTSTPMIQSGIVPRKNYGAQTFSI